MIRQTERTTPHRQYIASYEDAVTRKSVAHNPFEEPMIFSGIGAELLGGSHYSQSTVEKIFDNREYHRGFPLPDLRFHPDTLAVGENHLKTIYVPDNRDVRNKVQEEEVEDTEDNAVLDRLFSGGRRKRKEKQKK
jgi:hypothetical protein